MRRNTLAALLLWVIPMLPATAQVNYYLPQVANGQTQGLSLRTTFILFNTSVQNAAVTLSLSNDDGRPWSLNLTGLGSGSEFRIDLPSGGSRVLQTDGQGSMVSGAARATATSPVSVSAVFAVYDATGRLTTEAGVASSELLVDFLIPVDSTASFNTGLALFNPGSEAAVIQCVLTDLAGREVARLASPLRLEPMAHLARFTAGELFPAISNFRGALSVTSSSAIAAMTLRQNSSPLSYTTLPVAPRSTTAQDLLLPQIADGAFTGGKMRTSFILLNPSASDAAIELSLTKDDGSPWPISLGGQAAVSPVNLALPAGGASFLETAGTGPLTSGAARVRAGSPIGVSAIFTVFDAQDRFTTETAVAASPALAQWTLPVESGVNEDTGIAFFNPSLWPATVHMKLLDSAGSVAFTSPSLNLKGQSHLARFVSELFPAAGNFRGTLALSAGPPVSAMTLRQHSEPLSYTTLPVAPGACDAQLQAARTIGTAGGSVETSGITLTLPEGVLTSPTEIRVSTADMAYDFAGDRDAVTFLIDGLPRSYSKPIPVRIRRESPVTGRAVIAWGTENFIGSRGRTGMSFTLLEATYEGGYLIGQLPQFSETPPADSAENRGWVNFSPEDVVSFGPRVIIVGLGEYQRFDSTQGHFAIYYATSDNYGGDKVALLARDLEDAYYFFESKMRFSYAGRTSWPVKVLIRSLGNNDGQYSNSVLGDNYGYLEFDSALMNEAKSLRITAAHEFFHLVQSLYDPRWAFMQAKAKPAHHWINEAIAVWVENRFSIDSFPSTNSYNPDRTYLPPNFVDNERAPFRGVQAGAEDALFGDEHGYGMSAAMEFIIGTNLDSRAAPSIYERIRGGATPVAAILGPGANPSLNWFWNFWMYYPTGNPFRLLLSRLLSFTEMPTIVDSPQSVKRSFSTSFPDLSARLYDIHLYWDELWPAKMNLKFSGSDLTDIKYAFCYIDAKKVLECYTGKAMTSGVQLQDVENITALRRANKSLLLLLLNGRRNPPYNGKTAVSTDLEVLFPSGARIGSSSVSFDGQIRYWDGTTGSSNGLGGGLSNRRDYLTRESLTGTHYEAEWQYLDSAGNWLTQGRVSFDFNSTKRTLNSSFTEKWTLQARPQEYTLTTLELADVPAITPANPTSIFDIEEARANGASACNHIIKAEYKKSYLDRPSDELIGYRCNDNSRALIQLSSWIYK